jgi:hypothetical protein
MPKTPTRLTPELRKLQREWYKKLEADGFKDIESTHLDDGEFNRLKLYSTDFYKKYGHFRFHDNERYFALASQFLETADFESPWERFIWGCHASGMTLNEGRALVTGRDKWRAKLATLKTRFLEWVNTQGDDSDDSQDR